MNHTSANMDISEEGNEMPISFAARFLRATGEYALAMFGAMLLAFLWMAKDVVFTHVTDRWIEDPLELLILAFVLRQVVGRNHILVPVLLALGFLDAADWVKKHQSQS